MANYSTFKSTITQQIGDKSGDPLLDSADVSQIIAVDVVELVDSDYVSARAGGGGGGASVGTSVAMSLIFG